MPHRKPRRVPEVAPCRGGPGPRASPAPRSHPSSSPRPAACPSPLTSCTMPMVPPVLMTSTRASVLAEGAEGQPGRSWKRGPARALSRERGCPAAAAASIPHRTIRYLRAARTTGSCRGGREVAGPPLSAAPGAGRGAVPARPSTGSAREGSAVRGSGAAAGRARHRPLHFAPRAAPARGDVKALHA